MRKVNAANYGVPQHRKRVIAIGGLGWDPTFPEPAYSAYGAPGAALATRYAPAASTLMDALQGLPAPSTTEPGAPVGHVYRPLEGLDLERAKALQPGQTMRDLPNHLWHKSFQQRSSRRVKDGTPTERRGGAPFGVRRLIPDEPCKAITGGARSEFIHPFENRNLTTRELARIQTFPDNFVFRGTLAQQDQLIGNAVPPLLASTVARHLARDLQEAEAGYSGGALLSFVPTLSLGMSPALRAVTGMVRATFNHKPQPLDRGEYSETGSLRQLALFEKRRTFYTNAKIDNNGHRDGDGAMALTQSQRAILSKARSVGGGQQGVALDNDCRKSGFTPVLIVLDPTANEKLTQLAAAFKENSGEAHIEDAWTYLDGLAGPTMARFLEKYVHTPIQSLLAVAPESTELPDLVLKMARDKFVMSVGGETLEVDRAPKNIGNVAEDSVPEDADDQVPGV